MGNRDSTVEGNIIAPVSSKESEGYNRGFLSDRPSTKTSSVQEQNERLQQLSQRYKINNTTSHALSNSSRAIVIIIEGCTTISIGLPEGDFTSTWVNSQFMKRCRELGRDTDGTSK